MSPYYGWPFLSVPGHPLASAIWAVLIHGTVALIAVAPIVARARRRALCCGLVFAGGSILDLDHFIAAGSLSLHAIETLPGRPDTHSLLFAFALALLALTASRRLAIAWAVFAVDTAHLLFDAAGGHEHILYPFTTVDGIPWLLCPLGTLVLLAASAALAGARPRRERPRLPGLAAG